MYHISWNWKDKGNRFNYYITISGQWCITACPRDRNLLSHFLILGTDQGNNVVTFIVPAAWFRVRGGCMGQVWEASSCISQCSQPLSCINLCLNNCNELACFQSASKPSGPLLARQMEYYDVRMDSHAFRAVSKHLAGAWVRSDI